MSYDFVYETQGVHTYIVYQLKQQDELDKLSLGMLTNNKISGVAPVLFTQLDDKKFIKYNISSKVTVEQFFMGNIKKKQLIGVFSSIISALLEAEEYMIDLPEFLLDLNQMFVDVSTCEAFLICLPIEQENKKLDLGPFFKNIMFRIQFDQKENCDYVAKIINYLNSTSEFSLFKFKKILDEIKSNSNVTISAPGTKAITQGLEGVEQPNQRNVPKPPVVQPRNINIQKSLSDNVQGIQSEQMQQLIAAEKEQKPVKEKKKWFFFGSKEKKEKEKKQKPNKKEKKNKKNKEPEAVIQPGFAVPGAKASPAVNIPGKTPPGAKQQSVPFKPMPNVATQQSAPFKSTPNVATQQSAPFKPKPNVATQQAAPFKPIANLPTQQSVPIKPTPVQQSLPKQSTPSIQQGSAFTSSNLGQNNNVTPLNFNMNETTVLNSQIGETTVLNPGTMNSGTKTSYLIRIRTQEKILIQKDIFRIGKEKSFVDYFIADNTAVSRSHAHLIKRNGEFYVVDTNSTNHTFVDGEMIPSNQEMLLSNGATLAFGNEEFKFINY